MRVAVIGGGVAGRCIANICSRTHHVTLFSDRAKDQGSNLAVSESGEIYGLDWSFPVFKSRFGSMPVWGGLLAIPTQEALESFGIELNELELIVALVDIFDIEHSYGADLGPVRHLLKVSPTVNLSELAVEEAGTVRYIKESREGVRLEVESGGEFEFDCCLIATGAVCVPRASDGGVLLEAPARKIDKVISISRRDEPVRGKFLSRDGVLSMSVPIELPIEDCVAHKKAVYHHILSRSGVIPTGSLVWGYIINCPAFISIFVRKLLRRDLSFWFRTHTARDCYPLIFQEGRVEFVAASLEAAGTDLCMPALHTEGRVRTSELAGFKRIFYEHLDESHPPVPFNPVALRIAKLLAAVRLISGGEL